MKKSYIYGLVSGAVGFFLSWLICILFFKKIESDLLKVYVTLAPALIGGIIGMCFIVKASDVASEKEKEKKEHEKNERLKKLEEKYASYVLSVDKIVNKYEKELFTDYQVDKEKLKVVGIEVVNNNEYLFLLDKYINWVCENRIKGTPDTFIEAACLMYCLIKNPRIKYEELGDQHDNMFARVNYQIAWDVALDVISEPTTYYEDEDGKWLPKKHEKVEIIVPEGLIEKNPLYNRILSTIFKDCLNNEMDFYIIQFSNMLHLIYLNCKK